MASDEAKAVIQMIRARPAPTVQPTVAEMRAGMGASAAAWGEPVAGTVCAPVSAGGVPAEWITAPAADASKAFLYLHGGGYVIGSIDSHRTFVTRLSEAAGARGLALDYRLAPENPFPAAVDDAVAAYRWLRAQGLAAKDIAIAGDSAGGGLTLATMVALRDAGDDLPACGVCISPWADLELTGGSMTSRAAQDGILKRESLDLWASWYASAEPRSHPLISPLNADLRKLPPLLIQVGTAEVLYDDSTRLAERARAAGVDVTFDPWEEMFHIFPVFAVLPEARQATARIGEFLRRHLP